MTPESWLDNAEKISRMLSIAAIPVVLGVGGWWIQRQLQDQTIRRDYVQLSVSILQNPDPTKVPPEIRDWAVDLLNDNSPTKLNAKAVQNLKSGAITLAGFNFVPSNALTPDLQRSLVSSLQNFKAYMAQLGFVVPKDQISVEISPGVLIEGRGVAFWNPETHEITVSSAFATDPTSVLRQFTFDLLSSSENPSPYYSAIESGLATYFPCSFADDPVLGGKASAAGRATLPPQDLRNHRKFAEIRLNDWDSVQNDGSEVWGAALWDVRQLVGRQQADKLIAGTWQAFSPAEGENAYLSFANKLVANSQTVGNGKYAGQLRTIFERRGLRL